MALRSATQAAGEAAAVLRAVLPAATRSLAAVQQNLTKVAENFQAQKADLEERLARAITDQHLGKDYPLEDAPGARSAAQVALAHLDELLQGLVPTEVPAEDLSAIQDWIGEACSVMTALYEQFPDDAASLFRGYVRGPVSATTGAYAFNRSAEKFAEVEPLILAALRPNRAE